MPKSRGRKQRNGRSTRRRTPKSGDPRRSAQMGELADFLPIMQAADAAEARGDAAEALALMMERPYDHDGKPFRRPWRVCRLAQLQALAPILPRRATSRWILAQARQCLGPTTVGRHQRAMEIALRVRGGVRVPPGGNEDDARIAVLDHDWVYRQVELYELGGLDHFLRTVASPDLVAGADRIDEWARTPMGAYRFLSEETQVLRWQAVDSEAELQTINLGAGSLLEPGDCAIGRVVPIEEGLMFEAVPLFVPDHTALRVADQPHLWAEAVEAACQDRSTEDEQRCRTHGHDFDLLTDVPVVVQAIAHLDVTGRPGDFTDGAVAVVLAALGALLSRDPDIPWPVVAAALVQPMVTDRLLRELTPRDIEDLVCLADRVAGPASDLCRLLAHGLVDAA